MIAPDCGEVVGPGQSVPVLDLEFRVPADLSGVLRLPGAITLVPDALLELELRGLEGVGEARLLVFPFGKHCDVQGRPTFNDNFVYLDTPPELTALAGDRPCALVRWKEYQFVGHIARIEAVVQFHANRGEGGLEGARSAIDSIIAALSPGTGWPGNRTMAST